MMELWLYSLGNGEIIQFLSGQVICLDFFFLIIEPMFIDYLLSDGHSDVIGVTIANKTMGVPIVPQR